ncbi:hypothetical protein N7510_004927 [Penicillium lagena]|uniref:uncharacterized protein n=1 Tax=Penicillium lagena TaxID=94218 RepID=UPI0025424DA2|nr:uncharacterized protein N7510_004927 [Penicillium lagena]KAJ5620943.1 hypothetical protein N7510_004927 [Penicillium lagena]
MASTVSARAARSACIAARTVRPVVPTLSRPLSTSTDGAPTSESDKPRWSYTPPRAKAPFSLRMKANRVHWPVNSDPALLDLFYIRMLGNGGDKMLSEELKWLTVTHKSFDQGRRGFNDRLAFLGKRIVQLQASLALVQNPETTPERPLTDKFGRTIFSHPALDGLHNISLEKKSFLTDRKKLADVARSYDLEKVIRWNPKDPEGPNGLKTSGFDLVLAHTLYAVIGALSLEQGGQVASKVAKERILAPLGIKSVS